MKKGVVIPLLFLTLAAGGFAFRQQGRNEELAKEITQLRVTMRMREASSAELQDRSVRLENENKAFSEESAALRAKLSKISSAPEKVPLANVEEVSSGMDAEKGESKNPFRGILGKMRSDPKMREVMASMQMAAMKPMYADLVKQLHLSPEKSEEFFKLLAKQTAEGMDFGLKMLNGEKKASDGGNPFVEVNKEMKTLLGDDGFKQYETYQKTIPDRAAFSQISQQMAARQMPLRPDQSAGLMQIMQQEKPNAVKFNKAQTGFQKSPEMPSQEVLDETIQMQEERNARVLARSKTLLTPEQWKAFGEQQQQGLQMQKMGIEMAKGMMQKGSEK